MPQITVEYSASLAGGFDRRAFALALHATAAPIIDSALDTFKTRCRRIDECVIGDGAATQAMLHVEIAVLSGRDQEVKGRLADAALELAVRHLTPPTGSVVQTTVEIRDLDRTTYRKHVTVPAAERP